MDSRRVLIDGIAFENSGQKGVQRYYLEMLRRLPEDLSCTIFFNQPSKASLPQKADLIYRTEKFPVSRQNIWGRARRKFKTLFHSTRLPKAAVFHSTFFTRSPVPGLPEVVTVHDMIAECHPDLFPADLEPHVIQKKECILNATAIIAISEATRNDLVRTYPEVSSRVTVIHHGADHLQDFGVAAEKAGDESPYVLFVGDRAGYKNFATVLAAVAEQDWPRRLNLKVVGAQFSESEHQVLRQLRVESKVIHAGRVSDAELKGLYQSALAFIFPSLCEGFGFPLLEAQHMGVPVIASDIPAFREIGGDSVVFFKPRDPASLVSAITRFLEAGEREHFTALGRQNVRRFTWENCAQQTAEIFRAAAIGGS
ncbi:MAG: glycosyltransferase family 1 protein [Limisphaerales bacterium]